MNNRHQILDSSMLNTDAYALGSLAREVTAMGPGKCGDEIDRGLVMLRRLGDLGFQILKVHDKQCGWPGMECTCLYRRAALSAPAKYTET